jgi:DNA-binding response OmpR family regulator
VDSDDLLQAMREARERFVASFSARCDALRALVEAAAPPRRGGQGRRRSEPDDPAGAAGDVPGALTALRAATHQLAGLAGTVGFPGVSARARDLEDLASRMLEGEPFEADRVLAGIDALRQAFALELSERPPWSEEVPAAPPTQQAPLTVLVAEDDAEQRGLLAASLKHAGLEVIGVPSGDLVLDVVRGARPDAVLLDVNLPGLDGYSVCRQLKADPELRAIPVIFVTARGAIDERLTGLTLGADDYLTKPVETPELLMRLRLALARRQSSASDAGLPPTGDLPYDRFVAEARRLLASGPAVLALVHVPPQQAPAAIARLMDNIRRRDLVGRYSPGRHLVLFPDLAASAGRERMAEVVSAMARAGFEGIHAGLAAAPEPGARLEDLIAEADQALAAARFLGLPAAFREEHASTVRPTAGLLVLIADDDPDVVRLVDAHLRAAACRTLLAFDGQQAVDRIAADRPDLVVLDLMLPKLTGFEVLATIRQREPPLPRVLVLSARGREDDVTRAFELGAADYMTKPFSPQELLARLNRLAR